MKKVLKKISIKILFRLLIIATTSLLTMTFIEWRFLGNDMERTWAFITESTPVFLYNAMLLFYLELIISSFFKNPWTGPGITFIASIILSYITVQKQNFRGQPLLPEDFMLADQTGTITKFIDFGSLIRMLLACLLALGLIIILNNITKKFFNSEKKDESRFWFKRMRAFRATILAVGIAGFLTYSEFAINHGGGRIEEVPSLNTSFVAWNQMINYEKNGFILGFLYNWSKFELKAPDGYSEERIAEIKDEYNPEDEEEKNSLLDVDYNIVIVLNESFIDPAVISDYYHVSGGDVTPNLHKMIENEKEAKNYATGRMYTIDYGGGTANIEFEVDTSMSNYFLNTTPFVDLLPHIDKVPSIAKIAKSAGYNTLAIHPFNAGMYKRNIALKKEGFDQFISEDEMEFQEKDAHREYINDRSAYKETMKYLKQYEQKTLVSLITMQNHAGYGRDNFDNYTFEVSGDIKEDEKSQLEVYFESLHTSDQYMSEFLSELENFDEKTVVLFYGDHSPGIVSTVNDSEEKEVRDLSRYTPYFVWANFDLNNKFELPTTTPNCLTNTMFNLLDLEKPDYMKLVNDVCAEIPILAQAYYGSDAPFKSTTLSNYEQFIYDILGGKQYWYQK